MRSDMGKVVTEKPRRGSGNPSAKARHYGKMVDGEYYGPTKLPSSMAKAAGYVGEDKVPEKSFTDVLGPIRRYLHKQVGRPWDDVFSEVSRVLGSGAYPIRHVLHQHLLHDVARNCFRGDNGEMYDVQAYHGYISDPVRGFYVDYAGVLRWRPFQSIHGGWWRTKSREQWREIRPGVGYARVKGIWYYVEQAPIIGRIVDGVVMDAIQIIIDGSSGHPVGCKVKRQLGKKELRDEIYVKRAA